MKEYVLRTCKRTKQGIKRVFRNKRVIQGKQKEVVILKK